ncbi:MAG: 1-deoxy-D-xylulose-5-phosphate synthase [Clostridia bacterium]|nr:1-deoxy-D-xylulose-5-phosphate synthase [Clostridia bacterium]
MIPCEESPPGGFRLSRRLSELKGPEDLRGLSTADLERLAEEIRTTIIHTVARNGGHLGAGLGVVELALALHVEFQSPKDKLVWDVGHQAYPHKLLTGRFHEFHTLRKPGGLSGFLRRKESPHDVWEAGHASTAISAALGYAKARDLAGERHHVVAIVGDGALTGGLAYEGLNNAGALGTDLIVVLNDNSMSIAPNVGAIHTYLQRIRSQPMYRGLKDDIGWLLNHIPRIGPSVARTVERFKDSLKYLVLPGMWFEELGFTYLGPVDGHNIAAVREALRQAKSIGGPVVVHVLTVKGKGFQPAEEAPDAGHSFKPFDVATGKPLPAAASKPEYTAVFSRTLVELARSRPEVVAITAAMPDGTGTQAFKEAYPERFFDVGIAELHAVVFAAGLALGGRKPVVAIYSTFLQRAYDALVHDVGRMNLPVVFAIDRAGLVGADGDSHQGMFDIAYLRSIPNFVVMQPKDEAELRDMLLTALDYQDGPIALRYPRGSGRGVDLSRAPQPLAIGKGEVLREGRDVLLVALGPLAYTALEAAEILAARGVEATVVNARFAKPLDRELILHWARETQAVVTLEDGVKAGGFGSAVLELLSEEGLWGVRTRVLGYPDEYILHGDPDRQRAEMGLDAESVAEQALALVQGGRVALSPVRDAGASAG